MEGSHAVKERLPQRLADPQLNLSSICMSSDDNLFEAAAVAGCMPAVLRMLNDPFGGCRHHQRCNSYLMRAPAVESGRSAHSSV